MISYWAFYFLLKVGLHHAGYLSLWWLANLALAGFVFWPLRSPGLRRLRLAVALVAALLLLHRESGLPPLARIYAQREALLAFSLEYWIELVRRVIKPQAVLAFLAVLLAYRFLSHRIRFSTFAVLAILSIPLVGWLERDGDAVLALEARADIAPLAASERARTPDETLQSFYAAERQRRLHFSRGAGTPYDVIVLHVCSLAWDDMDFEGLQSPAFLQRADVVFTQFNSAASYSGPALMRVLHGACGQLPHDELYTSADPACNLFSVLAAQGYQRSALLNHDGHFDDFDQVLARDAGFGQNVAFGLDAPVSMESFDATPIYSDLGVLTRWWDQREQAGDDPVALYYNTISLHDGNRVKGIASVSSLQTFKPRFRQLMADFDRFVDVLEQSGRPVVLIMLPEHGAALRGDRMQMAGLREIPGPRITLVPAAIKVINETRDAAAGDPGDSPRQPQRALIVNKPVSYNDLYGLLDEVLRDPEEHAGTSWPERVARMPGTRFVAENEDVVVLRDDAGAFHLRSGRDAWIAYSQ